MTELIEKKDEQLSAAVRAYLRTGDLSMLPDQEKDKVLLKMCEHYSLDPVLRPFILIKLNGKEVWYPTKAATDQVAAKFNLTREVIEIKENIERGIIECRVKITQENSARVETCVAAVSIIEFGRDQSGKVEQRPMRGEAYANALMKVETKAKRRATLGWLGIADMQDPGEETVESKPVTVDSPALPGPNPGNENKAIDEKKRGPGRPSRAEIEARAMTDKPEEKIHLAEQIDALDKIETKQTRQSDGKFGPKIEVEKPIQNEIKIESVPLVKKETPIETPLAPSNEIGRIPTTSNMVTYSRANENHRHLMVNTLGTLGLNFKNSDHVKLATKISVAADGNAPIMDKDNQFLKREFLEFCDAELKKLNGATEAIDVL